MSTAEFQESTITGSKRPVDQGFGGISHPTLPEPDVDLSCKADEPPSYPNVVVDVKQDVEALGEDFVEGIIGKAVGERTKEEAAPLQEKLFEPDQIPDSRTKEQWVRIPVTEVEQWMDKDGPASITRTAKVTFPLEWGGEGVIDFINGFRSQNTLTEQEDPYDTCRIFVYDEDVDRWVVEHFGYVGGVGPSDGGTGKFYVYDPADLMRGINVSKGWAEPNINEVIEFILRGTDETGRNVGLENRSVFDGPIPTAILGEVDRVQQKSDSNESDVGEGDGFGISIEVANFQAGVQLGGGNTGVSLGPLDISRNSVTGLIGNALDGDGYEALQNVFNFGKSQKRFQVNRHNMVDVMDWITSLIDARWFFEPTPEGPQLVIDGTNYRQTAGVESLTRRYFVDNAIADDWQELRREQISRVLERFDITVAPENIDERFSEFQNLLPEHNYTEYARINTLDNNALVDIKPFNTLEVFGESTAFREATKEAAEGDFLGLAEDFTESLTSGPYSKSYPYAKVTYDPLLERANGFEYTTKPVESDKIFLDGVEQQAKKEFREHLAETTEGSITIRGEPNIVPGDYIVSTPACDGNYQNIDFDPVTWEVNSVKHINKNGKQFRTELGVSIAVRDEFLSVESEYRGQDG